MGQITKWSKYLGANNGKEEVEREGNVNNKRETDEKRPVTQDEVQTDDNSKRDKQGAHILLSEKQKSEKISDDHHMPNAFCNSTSSSCRKQHPDFPRIDFSTLIWIWQWLYLTTVYLHQKISTMYLLWSYCIVKHLLLLTWDTGKVRDRFGGMGRFKGGLRCKGLGQQCNYKCNYRN